MTDTNFPSENAAGTTSGVDATAGGDASTNAFAEMESSLSDLISADQSVISTPHIVEASFYGNKIDSTYQAFQGLQTTATSGSTTYGTVELLSTYTATTWVAGGFIRAMTASQDDTNLTIGTTGIAFEFFGGGMSETIGSLSTDPTTSQTGLFPLAWLSAIHEDLQTAWQPYYDSYLDFAVQEVGADYGSGATATAYVTSGKVTNIEIDAGGSGYTSTPIVTISGDGSGATAGATLSDDGVVTDISVTAVGSDYTSAPTVTFSTAAGSLGEALSGQVFQSVREGNTFSWADGYTMVQYEEGAQSITVGNLDSLAVLDMDDFEAQRQKIAEGLRGGKWPKMTVDHADLYVTDQRYPSPKFEVEIPSDFTTTNGPDEYNPELNFGSRRFGSKWTAATGNQVVFGTGSGDFNLGPVLNFSYYSEDAQKWSIDITDDMVKKLFSDWEKEFDVDTDPSTSAPEYASDLGATDYPTAGNIDSTQLFGEVPTDEWWTTRNELVKMGLSESYEICESGDVMYSWEKGNKREVLIEDEEGQKRSANYDDGKENYTYSQRDLTESESHIDGVLQETRNITKSLSTTIKTGFNLSTDITWVVGLSTDEVGFTMGGPEKPYDGNASSWKGEAYFDPDKWQGQGASGSIAFQSIAWEINTIVTDTSIKMTDPLNMRITSDFSATTNEAEVEISGFSWEILLAMAGQTRVKPTALFGKVWAKGQAGELSFADIRTFLSGSTAKAGPKTTAVGAELGQKSLEVSEEEVARASGASNAGSWLFSCFF